MVQNLYKQVAQGHRDGMGQLAFLVSSYWTLPWSVTALDLPIVVSPGLFSAVSASWLHREGSSRGAMTMTDEQWAAQVAKRARGEKQLSGSCEARAGRRRATESREVLREGGE